MNLKEFISGDKLNVHHSPWGDEKLRAKDFPLSKKSGKTYPLTRQWRWRVTTLELENRKFRLMATYHKTVPEFMAVLAEDLETDSRIIARLEFHGTHDGWHIHPVCDDFDNVAPGVIRPSGTKRLPAGGKHHRNREILLGGRAMSDEHAASIVSSVFRLGDITDLFSPEGLPW
jgi:hypothetical protein